MTARPGGYQAARCSVALDTDRSWTLRAVCRNDFRFSDGPFGVPGDPTLLARRLAHLCRAHCPVIAQCASETLAQAPKRPRKSVRAGVWFTDGGRPKVFDDTGCGSHCATLRGLPIAVAEATR